MYKYINESLDDNLSTAFNNKDVSDIEDKLLQLQQKMNNGNNSCADMESFYDKFVLLALDNDIMINTESSKVVDKKNDRYLLSIAIVKFLNGEGDTVNEFMFGVKVKEVNGICDVSLIFY